MKKRILALLLSTCMLLTLLPGLALAEGEDQEPPAGVTTQEPESPDPEEPETPSEEPTPEVSPSETASPEPAPTDTPEPTDTAEPSEDPEPGETVSPEPTDTASPEPTATATPTPTPTATPAPTPTATPSPSPKPTVYTITFDPNGGTVSVDDPYTNADGRLPSLPTPTRKGYVFDGWYTGSSSGTRITTDTVFRASVTVYAHWSKPGVTVTFHANGGTVSPKSAATGSNGRLESLPTPTRKGYRFEGWYFNASGNGSRVTTSTVFSSNSTIYARWTANSYTVTFHPNGGSVSTKSAVTAAGGKLSSLPTPTRNGYRFDGWYTKSDRGTRITTATVFEGNTTVYAHWTLSSYTVTFDPNGGSVPTKSAVTTAGGKLSSLPTPTRKGYRFDGWYTKADRGTQVTTATVFEGNTTVYAHWTERGTYQDSGGLSKLSKKEIAELLAGAPLTMPETVFSREPSVAAPYAPGKVTDEALNVALSRLNAIRRIAGLPGVKLDGSLNENAQYGAVLLAASQFSHYPPQPADMDDSFFKTAQEATSSSNIHYGTGGLYGTLAYSVDSFMDDSDGSNIDRVGHRRWQLNPKMGKVGFGYARKGGAGYICEKVFDTSAAALDYEFISWPASGSFPQELFDRDTAWSFSLNPDLYEKPSLSRVTVTLRRESDSTTWTFSGSGYQAASSGKYFNVENTGYGVNNCVIFRPDGVESYDGVYTVSVTGLRSRSGEELTLAYQVDFFGAEATLAPTPTPAPTASIPPTGTAYPSTQSVEVDGESVEFQMYALKDEKGYLTNYVKVRDLALALSGSPAQFSVGWTGAVDLTAGAAYTANGSENQTPFSGERPYTLPASPTQVGGSPSDLVAILLNDDRGGGYTYYQLRDLGRKLGFQVGWSAQRGVYIETDKPYQEET